MPIFTGDALMKENKTNNFGFFIDNTYLNLSSILYNVQSAEPVKNPKLVMLNENLAIDLGLSIEALKSADGVAILSGNRGIPESISFAQRYSGHQFGYFNHLGDGRALVIGEHRMPNGQRVDIQLKGSGRTPYSRRGDGRASLGPMLREYLISEAMANLGIPTTRSLSVVTTGEPVYRETTQTGAILTRVASSHIRVGTFQFAASHSNETLKDLFNYTLKRHYPECQETENKIECLLNTFAERQAKLMAQWQCAGFVHGVMNTDNVSLSGETIDYGPCAFIDQYHPDTVFSSIDTTGRYRYKNQPLIGKWNLARFAETLLPLFESDGERIANASLDYFDKIYESNWLSLMRKKLGLANENMEDLALIQELLDCMLKEQMDYHQTFLNLTLGLFNESTQAHSEAFEKWYKKWIQRRSDQECDVNTQKQFMQMNNPAIIPRNYLVERALDEWTNHGNETPFRKLNELLSNPFLYTDEQIQMGSPQINWPRTYKTTCGT